MIVRTIYPFTDRRTGAIRRTGDVFDCTPARLAEIQSAGRYVEAVNGGSDMSDDPDYRRFAAMSEDELRLYADQHFKLVFHSGVQKPEMIAAIMAREEK